MTMQRAVFLDRDGVINHDIGYAYRIEDFHWIDGVFEALRLLSENNYRLVIVTNQSGIGRGYYTEQNFKHLTRTMLQILAAKGIEIAHVAHCPHIPAELSGTNPCLCRKPMPGMLLETAALLGLDIARSVMIGDNASDIMAGRAAGVAKCFLIGEDAQSVGADEAFPNLLIAARYLTGSAVEN